MNRDALPPEALLEHAAWLRRLASGLVRGDGDADDLVQETWLAALRNPPRDEAAGRGWLGEVLRNARRMRGRAAGRRARREAELGALVEQASPSPEVLLARVEVQRRLAALVTELAEPLRSTVLLRYFEGLSAAEIARRQGIPAGTVRFRLKTGLDRLRETLDRESGGERARWGALLVPLAGADRLVRTSVWKGILLMSGTAKLGATVAAVALVVAATGWRTWRTHPAPRPAATARGSTGDEAREASEGATAPPASTSSAEARRARDAMRERILDTLHKRDASARPVKAVTGATSAAKGAAAAPPAEPGHYDAAYIQKQFREDMMPLLRQCYGDALLRQPQLGGRLVLTFTIVGDASVGGVVEDADFAPDSDIQDDEMRTCARESLMTLSFDKPPAGGGYVTVKYPILFAPGDDDAADAGGP